MRGFSGLIRRMLGGHPWRPRAYRMVRDSEIEPGATAGTVVYELAGWDVGCAAADTQALGTECLSVTLKPDGSPPFFVVPVRDLSACARPASR
ncbi:hypothetical protein AOPFMNJM_3763 [Methylobacterium jeotgali]|nr:hypothetical protein AOPFMNJM_3763 [Methylobacterium jeotgali]GJE70952.1 hypothetical protein CHKEEEPN_2494 [Methylorubrum podarium]